MKRGAVLVAWVVSVLLVQAAAADMVVNGGFETGDFTGWVHGGDAGGTSVGGDMGAYYAVLGPVPFWCYLEQDIVTSPGASYRVSFWVSNWSGNPNTLAAYWGAQTIVWESNIKTFLTWQEYEAVVTASGYFTRIGFGVQSPYGFFRLDDISVTLVPIPATALLLGSALIPLAWARRKKRLRK